MKALRFVAMAGAVFATAVVVSYLAATYVFHEEVNHEHYPSGHDAIA